MDSIRIICTKCSQEKDCCEFHRSSKKVNGYKSHCKACVRSYEEGRYAVTKDRQLAWNKAHRQANPARTKARAKVYRESRSDEQRLKDKQAIRKWKKSNRSKVNATGAHRRAKMRKATPAWADKKAIESFYTTAHEVSMVVGEWYQVDHIVPLVSKFVCGLHCEANLQILDGIENRSKSNKWWPDMWEPIETKKEHICLT